MLLGFVSIVPADPIVLYRGDNPMPVVLTPHYRLYIDSQYALAIYTLYSPIIS